MGMRAAILSPFSSISDMCAPYAIGLPLNHSLLHSLDLMRNMLAKLISDSRSEPVSSPLDFDGISAIH